MSVDQAKDLRDRSLVDLADPPDNIYRTNIQISELNALNACLAVIQFKRLRGFYLEDERLYQLLFDLADLKVVGE